MAGKGWSAKHLTVAGWRYKRERGTNRPGTRTHSQRIVMRQAMKRQQDKQETIKRTFERNMKGQYA